MKNIIGFLKVEEVEKNLKLEYKKSSLPFTSLTSYGEI